MSRSRKFFTSGLGFIFLVVGVTGVIFKLFFKTRALEEIHGWLGLAMVLAALIHIFQNWKSLRNHLRDQRVFALLLPIVLVITYFAFRHDEPVHTVNSRQVIQKLSQASANDVAKAFGDDVSLVFVAMKRDGLRADQHSDSIKTLADENQRSPDMILAYFLR